MPRAESNNKPRGQAYGASTQQENFVQATGGRPVPEETDIDYEEVGTDDPDESFDLPGFGSMAQSMLGPTQRPDEDPRTRFSQGPRFDLAAGPNPDVLRLIRDPNISSEFRETLKLAIIARALGEGSIEIPDE